MEYPFSHVPVIEFASESHLAVQEYCFPLRKSPTHILQLSHHLFPQHQLINIVPVIPGAEDMHVSVDDNETNHAHAAKLSP